MPYNPRIVIETFSDDRVRDFHVNARLTYNSYREGDISKSEMSNLNSQERNLVNDLHAISGVTEVSLGRYHVQVTIDRAFDWKPEIEVKVIDLIEEFLRWDDLNVEIRHHRTNEGRSRFMAPREPSIGNQIGRTTFSLDGSARSTGSFSSFPPID